MRQKLLFFAVTGLLALGGLAYGFASQKSGCPLEGTPMCPKNNCPLKGTPECPYDGKTVVLPDCCKK
jgi:hypothetical protein